MGGWVQTQVPCMVYCGDELCNCEARFFYDEEDDWSILDKKGQEAKNSYDKYLTRLLGWYSHALPEAGRALSKEICTLQGNATGSVLR